MQNGSVLNPENQATMKGLLTELEGYASFSHTLCMPSLPALIPMCLGALTSHLDK